MNRYDLRLWDVRKRSLYVENREASKTRRQVRTRDEFILTARGLEYIPHSLAFRNTRETPGTAPRTFHKIALS